MSTEYVVLILAGLVFLGALFAAGALAVGLVFTRSKPAPAAPSAPAAPNEGEILHAAIGAFNDVAGRKAAVRIAEKLTDHKAGVIQADFGAALSDPKDGPPK